MQRQPSRPVQTRVAGSVDVSTLLDELHGLESEVAHLYEWFAALYAEVPGAETFFTQMSREEHKHADLVKFQRQLVMKDRAAFPPVEIDLGVVRTTIERVRAYRSQPTPPSLTDAVDFAIRLENDAAETHYRTVLSDSNPTLAKLIQSLSSADEHHAAALQSFARELGLAG